MTQEFFKTQVSRLKVRFGDKAFDPEFAVLIWREVKDMSDAGFARFCDVMIGSRPPNKPPLLSEFREARLAEEKLRFDNETRGAGRALERSKGRPLSEVLKPHFGGVSSVGEAMEIARLRLRTDDNGPEGA